MGFKPRPSRLRSPTFLELVALDVAERLLAAPVENPNHPMCRVANQCVEELIDEVLKDVPLAKIQDQGGTLGMLYWIRRQKQGQSTFTCGDCRHIWEGKATYRSAEVFTSYVTCCPKCGDTKILETFRDGATLTANR